MKLEVQKNSLGILPLDQALGRVPPERAFSFLSYAPLHGSGLVVYLYTISMVLHWTRNCLAYSLFRPGHNFQNHPGDY